MMTPKATRSKSTSTMATHNENRPLRDYVVPNTRGLRSSIRRSPIEANNFELKLAYLSMIQQNQFGDTPIEDSNIHLEVLLEFY